MTSFPLSQFVVHVAQSGAVVSLGHIVDLVSHAGHGVICHIEEVLGCEEAQKGKVRS